MTATNMTETTVDIAGEPCRALIYDNNKITIVTGPALLDRLAQVIDHCRPYVAELHPGVTLTPTQITIGVMTEIAAMDGVQVRDEHVSGDDWDDDAQALADQVAKIVDPGWVSGVIGSVYTRHAR